MSTPNPLVPEGSLQQSKGKSNVKIAFFAIVIVHVVFLGGLLMQGCKEKPKTALNNEEPMAVTNETASINPAIPAPDVTGNTTALPANSAPTAVPTPAATTVGVASTAAGSTGLSSTAPLRPAASVEDPSASASAKEYTIASGDTLGKVAKENHVSVKALQEANPAVNPTKLKIGQKIQIPASTVATSAPADATASIDSSVKSDGVYVVKAGDMLERIAKNHGTSVKAIKTANNLKTDRLKVGQKLKLPAAKVTATAAATPVAPENPLATTTLTPATTVAAGTK